MFNSNRAKATGTKLTQPPSPLESTTESDPKLLHGTRDREAIMMLKKIGVALELQWSPLYEKWEPANTTHTDIAPHAWYRAKPDPGEQQR